MNTLLDALLALQAQDDVVDALLLAEKSESAVGQVVHVVDPTTITQNDYLREAARTQTLRVMRLRVWVLMVLAFKIELLGRLLKRDVPLSRYKIRSLQPLWPFDVAKARELLGWSPKVGSTEGLRRTFGRAGES